MVHKQDISDAVKMHHLRSTLKGDAAKFVTHIAPNAENYAACYLLLEKCYNNKRELLGISLNAILNLSKHKTETSEELRKLHDAAKENLMAIKNLGFDTTNWGPLVSHILLQKLSKDRYYVSIMSVHLVM